MLLGAERIPNEAAIALSPTIGWLMFAAALCLVVGFTVHREAWRRLWLRVEDPRSIGVFRILFGLTVLGNINGMWESFEYLFTDEGMFMTDVAREVFAREQFRGFANGLEENKHGFLDGAAVWQFLKGPKYSLLFFWSSPRSFWIHLVAFEIATCMLIVGLWTRYTKWIAWFLFHSIILRNSLFWEGTENVYRTLYFYLCLSRCGSAYSVDNWLRCRRLRAAGRLSEPGGRGDGAGTPADDEGPALEPIYRSIPGWPRLLVILQVAALYCDTGVLKNGRVWQQGDAFYYALNLDHFYRFEPQGLSAVFGTNLFRLNTHVVHVWESAFPLVVVGLVVRWAIREHVPKPPPGQRWLARAAVLGFWGLCLAITWLAYPEHYTQPPRTWLTLDRVRWIFAGGWVALGALVAGLYYGLGRRQGGFDLYALCSWVTGRRVWLLLGLAFHTHLIVLMNIGWFSPCLLTAYVCFLRGEEAATVLRTLRTAAARLVRKLGPAGPWIAPARQDLKGAHRDDRRMPTAVVWTAVGLCAGGVALQVYDVLHFGWTLLGVGLGLVVVAATGWAEHGPERPPTWAYGRVGRTVVTCLVIFHITGVACWLLPSKDMLKEWRVKTHEPFKWWLRTTQTSQGWAMFAPNPPRSNLFMQVLVTDADGEVWDMNTDVYHPAKRPLPWVWYTRERKMNRRIAGAEGGKGSWYQKWHARYICRKWELDHGGERAKRVELVKITYSIPSPLHVKKAGPYDPVERLEKHGKYTKFFTAQCDSEVDAQMPASILARHRLEPKGKVKRWGRLARRERAWKRHQERVQKKKTKPKKKTAK